jgi:hypothetical protein
VPVLAAGVLFRVWRLDSLPGINGDEAWYGNQILGFLNHQPFEWRTPSGLPISPWHALTLTLAHLLWRDPSFWVLRIPSLTSGLALLLLTYPLMRRALGPDRALLSLLAVSSLPVLIAYSRLSWDPSHGSLLVLVALYFGLRRRLVPAAAAQLLAALTHPTFIFAAPVIVAPDVAARLAGLRHAPPEERRRQLVCLAALVAGAAAVLGVVGVAVSGPVTRAMAGGAGGARGPAQAFHFIPLVLDFLSGMGPYRYLVGLPDRWAIVAGRAGVGGALLVLLAVGLRNLVRRRAWTEVGMIFGLALAIAAQFATCGLDRKSVV